MAIDMKLFNQNWDQTSNYTLYLHWYGVV